jgi:uncharacterized protein YdeI (YjbR/CyaY-like superfamily)
VKLSRPTRDEVTVFANASDFREWLERNHETARELWVGYYRKATGKSSMTYAEAVEEALCYGWIDGLTYRVDDEIHTNRFTPRRPTSNWSAINIAKVAELTAAGRMHPAGTRAFETRDRRKDASYSYEREAMELDPAMVERLRADADATRAWDAETRSFRRQATYWVMSAKRPETRERRFETLLTDVRAGRRPRPFLVESRRAERR